jgi:hypothetical protein
MENGARCAADAAESLQARWSCARRSCRSQTGTIDAPTIALKQATGFGIFMLKAVLSGRADEIVDLAKVIFFATAADDATRPNGIWRFLKS